MRRSASSLHLFMTLLLLVGLFFGAFGRTLVSALGADAVPTPQSFKRQYPASSPANADTLTFRVTFSAAVSEVDSADFMVHDNTPDPVTTASGLTVSKESDTIYDVVIFGGDLGDFNGVVGLDFSLSAVIKDLATNLQISTPEPAIDETYLVDNIRPTLTIDQAAGQPDPASTQPVVFTVAFSKEIDPATFTPDDLDLDAGQVPVAHVSGWNINDSGDHQNFSLIAKAATNGWIVPTILANRVFDLAGNGNLVFTGGCVTPEPNNCVALADTFPPGVDIEQYVNPKNPATSQADPAWSLPVKFSITFSEPINIDDVKTSIISQTGTAGFITWSISPTSNPYVFILFARESTPGTLRPIIQENQVRDLIGNYNRGSTSLDNSVTYQPPVPSPTPIPPTGNLTARSIGAYDGWILESSGNSNVGGTLNSASGAFILGDDAQDKQYRAILHFDTSSLPNNAVVTRAVLRIRRQAFIGIDPFTALGSLRVDMSAPFFGATAGLTIADFQTAAGKQNVAAFSSTPDRGWYIAELNAAGMAYINLFGTTQFRLRFAMDDNDNQAADYMLFFSGNCGTTSLKPALIIEYYIP